MSTGGITDEAAIEGHDLIHSAEIEEQRAHGSHALTQPDYGEEGIGAQSTTTTEQPQQPQQQPQQLQQPQQQPHHHDKSMKEKVKEALHMKK